MRKVDLRAQLKHLYRPPTKEVVVVDVPPMNFLMVDGAGDPNNSPAFQQAVEALYGVSYTLKFMIKRGSLAIDYPVMALEGLWWSEGTSGFSPDNKDAWLWTLMIMQPDFVTEDLVAEAMAQVAEKKHPPALSKIRFESFHEGQAAQIMHIGPFSEEGPTIQRIHAFARENGYALRGKHHEIYLSDPRRAKLERIKTVIRQPVQ